MFALRWNATVTAAVQHQYENSLYNDSHATLLWTAHFVKQQRDLPTPPLQRSNTTRRKQVIHSLTEAVQWVTCRLTEDFHFDVSPITPEGIQAVRAPLQLLCYFAEKRRIQKALRDDLHPNATAQKEQHSRDNTVFELPITAPFSVQRAHQFRGFTENPSNFFTSAEQIELTRVALRQALPQALLQPLHDCDGPLLSFHAMHDSALAADILSIKVHTRFLRKIRSPRSQKQKKKEREVFNERTTVGGTGRASAPVPCEKSTAATAHPCDDDGGAANNTYLGFSDTALHRIAAYFGMETGFYFGFLSFYNTWLLFPALAGAGAFLATTFVELDCTTVFYIDVGVAIGSILWATIMLESWRRRSSMLGLEWAPSVASALDEDLADAIEEDREEFDGSLAAAPFWKLLCTYSLCFFFVACAASAMVVSFLLEAHAKAWSETRAFSTWLIDFFSSMYGEDIFASWEFGTDVLLWIDVYFIPLLPTIMYSASIPPANALYTVLATRLTDWENHRTFYRHRSHTMSKLAAFYFANCYMSLFFCAYYLRDFGRLRRQMSVLLVTNQLVMQVVEVGKPFVMGWLARRGKKHLHSTSEWKAQSVKSLDMKDAQLLAVHNMALPEAPDLFFEYAELWVQFGYVALFGLAWPLAGLCALVNNVIELRTDLFKLLSLHRRHGNSHKVFGIGIWTKAFTLLALLAAANNFAMLAVRELWDEKYTGATVFGGNTVEIIFVALVGEHIMLALKMAIGTFVKDRPAAVLSALAERYHYMQEMTTVLEARSISTIAEERAALPSSSFLPGNTTRPSAGDGQRRRSSSRSRALVERIQRIQEARKSRRESESQVLYV